MSKLAAKFQVTAETVRRDLSELQERRVVRRVHGGAVPWENFRYEPMITIRGDLMADEKRRIAQLALEEVPHDGLIIIDSGSTAARLVELFPRDRKLTVVTNSVPAAHTLAGNELLDIVVLGGTMKKNTLAMVDSSTAAAVSEFVADVLFMSCDGISIEHGLTTPYRDEAVLKRAMIATSRRTIVMFDHTKVNNDQAVKFAAFEDVDTLITDDGLPAEAAAALQSMGPIVRRA